MMKEITPLIQSIVCDTFFIPMADFIHENHCSIYVVMINMDGNKYRIADNIPGRRMNIINPVR
jgi:hypothetical protein